MTERKRLTEEELVQEYKKMAEDEDWVKEQIEICREFEGCLLDGLEDEEYLYGDSQNINTREFAILNSFEEAKEASDGAVILEGVGEIRGVIYLTCPMKYVKCSEEVLKNLIEEINHVEMHYTERIGNDVYYCRAKSGDIVFDEIVFTDGLWIWEGISESRRKLIEKVINGELTSIKDEAYMEDLEKERRDMEEEDEYELRRIEERGC